jgi:hypothetical protein
MTLNFNRSQNYTPVPRRARQIANCRLATQSHGLSLPGIRLRDRNYRGMGIRYRFVSRVKIRRCCRAGFRLDWQGC